MRYATSIISGVILLLTGIIAVYTYNQVANLPDMQKGAFEFAILYLAVLGLCSFGAMLTGLAEAKLDWAKKVTKLEPQFFLFGLVCVLYLLALTYVGYYLPVTVLALVASMLVLGIKPLHAAAVSLGFTSLIFFAFTKLLNVPLP